jgi:hypothetical protein
MSWAQSEIVRDSLDMIHQYLGQNVTDRTGIGKGHRRRMINRENETFFPYRTIIFKRAADLRAHMVEACVQANDDLSQSLENPKISEFKTLRKILRRFSR